MKSTALFSIFLLSACTVWAQSAPTKLNLQQAVQLAVDKNPDLQKRRLEIDLAKASYKTSWGAFLPTLNGSVGFSKTSSTNYSEGFDTTTRTGNGIFSLKDSDSKGYNWSLNSSVNLFSGGYDWKTFENSTNYVESSKLRFGRSVQTTILDVTSNFLLVLQRQELLKISKEDLSYQEEQLKKITEMTRLGSRPMVDLYNQQYAKANAELNVINAEKNVEIAKSDLVSLLALDPTLEYDIEMPPLDGIKQDPQFTTLSTLVTAALNQRPDFQDAKLAIKTSQNKIWTAYTGYSPSLDLTWNWGANGNPDLKPSLADQLGKARSYTIGLTLSVPIFNGFTTDYAVQQANIEYKNSQYDLEKLERTIQIGVKQAWLDYKSYKKAYEASEAQFKAASLLKETAQERYNVGAGSYLELANATKDFISAASNLTTSKYQFEFQKKVLEFYIGSLNPEDYVNIR